MYLYVLKHWYRQMHCLYLSTNTFYWHVLTLRCMQIKQVVSVCICTYKIIDTYRYPLPYPGTDKLYLVSICLRYWQDKADCICLYLPSGTGRYAPAGLLMHWTRASPRPDWDINLVPAHQWLRSHELESGTRTRIGAFRVDAIALTSAITLSSRWGGYR